MSPSTSPERRARWPGMYSEAIAHLESSGFIATARWTWIPPTPEYVATERDIDAIGYLIEEWDWGGIDPRAARGSAGAKEKI